MQIEERLQRATALERKGDEARCGRGGRHRRRAWQVALQVLELEGYGLKGVSDGGIE